MLTDFLNDQLGQPAGEIVAKLLLVALILLLTWLAQAFVTRLLPSLLRRVARRVHLPSDGSLVRALRPPSRLLITTLGLYLAALALEPSPTLADVLDRLMRTLAAIAIFWGLLRVVAPLARTFIRARQRGATPSEADRIANQTLQQVIEQLSKAVLVVIAAAVIIELWGFNVAGLLAGFGIGGLAVALAAQDTLANLFGYFVILADEPFKVGEYVVFNQISGTVEAIGLRSTRIRVLDQSLVTVPNNTVMNASITNWSRLAKRRLNATLTLQYGSDPATVLSVVQSIRLMLQSQEQVQGDSVIAQFVDYGENSLQIMLICFVNTPAWADFQAARQDINLKIMQIMQDHGVTLATPTRTVFLESAPPTPPPASKADILPPLPEPTTSTATDSPVPPDAAN